MTGDERHLAHGEVVDDLPEGVKDAVSDALDEARVSGLDPFEGRALVAVGDPLLHRGTHEIHRTGGLGDIEVPTGDQGRDHLVRPHQRRGIAPGDGLTQEVLAAGDPRDLDAPRRQHLRTAVLLVLEVVPEEEDATAVGVGGDGIVRVVLRD